MIPIKLIYIANILVAGWISISSLFYPKIAQRTVFEGAFEYSESIRLVGALWGAIFILSILGLFFPQKMSLVLFFQLIYKFSWLIFAALPAILNHQTYPKGMAIFFVIWVILLLLQYLGKPCFLSLVLINSVAVEFVWNMNPLI